MLRPWTHQLAVLHMQKRTEMFDTPSKRALVPFISVEWTLSLIFTLGFDRCLFEITDAIAEAFTRWNDFETIPRVASHSSMGVIELMPTTDGTDYSFKYVNGHPINASRGLQTVAAFGVLASVETGYPKLIAEMTLLTAMRTAAMSALATRTLARKDSHIAAIIGNGAQSEFQIRALATVCGIKKFQLYDIDTNATRRCIKNLSNHKLCLTACSSTEEAVLGADVITTCTADKAYQTILTDNLIGKGVHVNAIGGDCPGKTELHRDVLLRSDIFVEYAPQTRLEGEIQQLDEDFPVTEIWQVLTGSADGRKSPGQITVFDGVGFAIEDFAALRWLEQNLGNKSQAQNLDLIADPNESKDLYGMICRFMLQAKNIEPI